MSMRTYPTLLFPPLSRTSLVALSFMLACGPQAPRPELPDDLRSLVEGAEDRCGSLEDGDKEGCYEEVILSRLDEEGVYEAIRVLAAIGSWDPEVERNGHMYVHGIGITSYQNNPNWSETFGQCTELYQSGCYHGVIQARFMEMGEVTPVDINELCELYNGDPADRFVLFQCLHGAGHGLTMLYGHDLPVALEGCDHLAENWDRQSCYGGAFMENIMNATAPHHMVDDMMAEAGEVEVEGAAEADLRPWCYVGFVKNLIDVTARTEGAFAFCPRLDDRLARLMCYQAIGEELFVLRATDEERAAECAVVSEDEQAACLLGARIS